MGGTAITRTLWSGTDELAEFDGAGALLRRDLFDFAALCAAGPGPGIDGEADQKLIRGINFRPNGAYVFDTNKVRYFHADRLGSVVAPRGQAAQIDGEPRFARRGAANDPGVSAGAASDQYAYSPFGESDAPLTGNL